MPFWSSAQVNADLLDVGYVEPGAADRQLVILHGFPLTPGSITPECVAN